MSSSSTRRVQLILDAGNVTSTLAQVNAEHDQFVRAVEDPARLRIDGSQALAELDQIEAEAQITGQLEFDFDAADLASELDRVESQADIEGQLSFEFDAATLVRQLGDVEREAQVQGSLELDDTDLTAAETAYRTFARLVDSGLVGRLDLPPDDLREALRLAEELNDFTARIDVDVTDDELEAANALAERLAAVVATVEVQADQTELLQAFRLAESIDAIDAEVVVRARDAALREAIDLAEDLERPRTVPIDADASELAGSVEGAISSIDVGAAGSSIVNQLTGILGQAGPWGAAGAAAALVFADEFAEGLDGAFNRGRSDALTAIRFGLSSSQMAEIGEAGGQAFGEGFGTETAASVRDTAALVERILGDVDPQLDLTQATRASETLAEVWETDLPRALGLVRRLINQELVPDATAGFDLIFAAQQRLPDQADELLDNLTEFGPVYQQLGFDGAQAADFIADAWEAGLLTNVSRANELLEEFVIRLRSPDAEDAITRLGLSFADVQEQLATGFGDEALRDIVTRLLEMEDAALRDELAVEILGQGLESAAGQGEILALILDQDADALDRVAGTSERATAALAESRTVIDELQRGAVETGGAIGSTLLEVLEDVVFVGRSLNDIELGAFGQEFANAEGDVSTLGDAIGALTDEANLFGEQADQNRRGLIDLSGPLDAVGLGFLAAQSQATGLTEALKTTSDEVDPLTDGLDGATEGLDGMSDGADDAASSLQDTAESLEQVQSALGELFDFEADQLFRSIADETQKLAERAAEADGSLVGLNGQIDISTEAGSRLQEQFERVSGEARDLTEAFVEGDVTQAEFERGMRILNSAIEAQISALGLDTAQAEGLRQKYLDLRAIDRITTDAVFNDSDASNELAEYRRQLRLIPNNVTTTVTTRRVTVNVFGGGVIAEEGGIIGPDGPVGFTTPTDPVPARLDVRWRDGPDDRIVQPRAGGVQMIINGVPTIAAENAGAELLLNSRSPFERQLSLIHTFDNGRLLDRLAAHFEAKAAAETPQLTLNVAAPTIELGRPSVVAIPAEPGVSPPPSAAATQTVQNITMEVPDRGRTDRDRRLALTEAAKVLKDHLADPDRKAEHPWLS